VRYLNAKHNKEPRPELIKLDPQQVKILDALADAAGIPHQRGQTEITIPEHSRHGAEDSLREYEERLRAEDDRRRGK
jgi:hypothetical protein